MIININKSYLLALSGIVLVSGSSLILLFSPFPALLKIPGLALILGLGYLQLRRSALLRSPRSVIALKLRQDAVDAYLASDPERAISCRIVRRVVAKHLVVLRIRQSIGGRMHALFLLRGMCSNNEFRLLKRYLLGQKQAAINV